jgi:hypothetical protein
MPVLSPRVGASIRTAVARILVSRATACEPDACVVETGPLCDLVTTYVAEWLETRRSRKGQRGYDAEVDVDPFSPYAWIAFDTGIPEAQIRKLRTPTRYPLAELSVADAIVNSIGEPGMFHDGTLTIMPNPFVTDPRRRAECCGGSEVAVSYTVTRSSIVTKSLASPV